MYSFDERGRRSGERSPFNRASRREAVLTWLAILVMLAAFSAFVAEVARYLLRDGAVLQILEGAVYVALVSLLMYGALVYLCARHGYLRRLADHRRGAPPGGLATFDTDESPRVVI